MFGPAGMPKEALDRISQSVMKAVKRPDLSDRLLKMGFEPNGSTPAELGARLRTDFSAWEKPAKGTGLSLE
jgi:tripartite-type tricarboxylate transporter receptor subunit TctC